MSSVITQSVAVLHLMSYDIKSYLRDAVSLLQGVVQEKVRGTSSDFAGRLFKPASHYHIYMMKP